MSDHYSKYSPAHVIMMNYKLGKDVTAIAWSKVKQEHTYEELKELYNQSIKENRKKINEELRGEDEERS